MAAKCNIVKLVSQKLNALIWGISCDEDNVDRSIIRNYIEYLNCDLVVPDECDIDTDCINEPIILTCNDFEISSILATYPDKSVLSIILSVESAAIIGGNSPFSYVWEYNTDDFDISGNTTSDTLALTLKDGKSFETLISKIKVTITDSLGCVAIRECYIIPEIFPVAGFGEANLECNTDYEPCVNPKELEVSIA